MEVDDLVLCDLGAKKIGICSDITTTFPVSGKFNDRQKVVLIRVSIILF